MHPSLAVSQDTSSCSESDMSVPMTTLMAPSIAPVALKAQQLPGKRERPEEDLEIRLSAEVSEGLRGDSISIVNDDGNILMMA